MQKPDFEAEAHFSQPFRQIAMMLVVLGLCGAGGFIALPRVLPVFQANPWLNGFIAFVFVLGVVACFLQVAQLIQSVRWIETFLADRDAGAQPPRLLAPLASLLRRRDRRLQITTTSTRSILDSVATRIDEAREITRYIVSLLIFLGLLGTFYGLATTVPALVDTIRSLAPAEGESNMDVFSRLMSGLEGQLGGMGVAFASSLLGLAGSLIVGLLELETDHVGAAREMAEHIGQLHHAHRPVLLDHHHPGYLMPGHLHQRFEQILIGSGGNQLEVSDGDHRTRLRRAFHH